MINRTLSEIVHCTNCGAIPLTSAEGKSQLNCKKCGANYEVKNGVLVMLPNHAAKEMADSEIHSKQSSVFNYIDHYQKDGIEHDYFQERDPGTEHIERRVREQIFSQFTNTTGKVLDVGCGRAWVAQHLCPKNYEVISMDISLKNTTEALKLYPFKNHSAIVADVFSLPFNENSFDYIIASEIIEHVVDPKIFVENLMRALKPGGTLIVTTPYKEKIRYSLCVHCNKLTPLHAHIHSFDEKILSTMYAGEDLQSCNYITFANKIPIHLRMHLFFRFFGFRCWKIADRFFNLIHNSPMRILVKWQKK
ncbi:class I SAM-dependent methyltransferase [uncultured Draconibacterium sp.]|uniref:class I SAM-dependent methyltransferase n=1 Tax=uncultured Draconibacterium sp. TaxID=1573823 RepID=UPI0025CD6007|nr:class I SAM-dependent methyltransferase [uncultured Draconibacterium sp.]